MIPAPASTATWKPDTSLTGFEAMTLKIPDDSQGPAVATLVRRRASATTTRAVLYVHGFVDYFFQAHMAERYNAEGYHFYALDLHGYGRSLLPHQHPNFCAEMSDYFPEIDAAIDLVTESEGCSFLLLSGHSTGGLTTSLYAGEGARRQKIRALFLNSPLLHFNTPTRLHRFGIPILAALGSVLPFAPVDKLSPLYGHSVHRSARGEWDFSLQWKPHEGFPVFAGWMRAVHRGQQRLKGGLPIACPVLLMHSARSINAKHWTDELLRADAVLNVEDMRRLARYLGPNVSMISIEGGLHDLVLSAAPVREQVFGELFAWLGRVGESLKKG